MNKTTATFLIKYCMYLMLIPVILFAIGVYSLPSIETFWIDAWDLKIEKDTASNTMSVMFVLTIVISSIISAILGLKEKQIYKAYCMVWVILSFVFGVLFSLITTDYIFPWGCILLVAPSVYFLFLKTDEADKFLKEDCEE